MKSIYATLGITDREGAILQYLLTAGSSAVGQIAKNLETHRTSIYDGLQSLITKGLVSSIEQDGVKIYTSLTLNQLVQKAEQSIIEARHQIQSQCELKANSTPVRLFTGNQAIRDTLSHMLASKNELCILGELPELTEHFPEVIARFHAKRVQQKLPIRVLATENSATLHSLNQLPHTKAKYLSDTRGRDLFICITDDCVRILICELLPKIIVIEREQLTEAYRSMFDILWNQAENPTTQLAE